MPTWWPELVAVPQEGDVHRFTRRVWASFQMPKECYCTTKGYNDYTVPPALHCIDWNAYLPLRDMRFATQDYCLSQPRKTLAYAKALQHWAEEAKHPMPGKLCQLAECIHELRGSMEPFTTLTDAEVFGEVEPSNWVQVTPSKSSEPAESTPPHS